MSMGFGGIFGTPGMGGKSGTDYKMRLAYALMNRPASNNPYDYSHGLNQLTGALMGYSASKEADERESNKAKTYAEALKAMGGEPERKIDWNSSRPDGSGEMQSIIPAKQGSLQDAANIFAANPDTAGQGWEMMMKDAQQKQQFAREDERYGRQRQDTLSDMTMKRGWSLEDDARNFGQQKELARFQAGLSASNRPSFSTVSGKDAEALGLPPGTVAQRNNQTGQIEVVSKPSAGGQILGYTPDGEPIMAQGVKPMTEGQANAALYADRIAASEPTIREKGESGTSFLERTLGAIPVIGNSLVSDDYRQLDQAQRDYINAVLRRESGAVISDQEFDNARKQYFPMPGDDPATIAQKERNRKIALEGISRAAGPAYRVQQGMTPPGQGAVPQRVPEPPPGFVLR